ncbi:MAG: hypothetical protein ACRECE_00605 [Xanthobacteraceae bacterium]
MASKRNHKCRICGELFTADARNRKRQRYCPKPACKGAGKAARQRRWRAQAENRDYFRGAEQVQRVREWRAAHPGYWRRYRRAAENALQDALDGQPVDLTAGIDRSAQTALQDALRCQGPVLIGLIAHLSDSALQADIVATSRRLLQLGQDILGGKRSDAHQAGAAP